MSPGDIVKVVSPYASDEVRGQLFIVLDVNPGGGYVLLYDRRGVNLWYAEAEVQSMESLNDARRYQNLGA